MRIRVHGGTPPNHDETLCDTCAHSKIVRGQRLEESLVFCTGLGIRAVAIHFRVSSCTGYGDRREPSYYELFEKAWILKPPTKRRTAGFVHASDLTPEETQRIHEDIDDID